MARITRRSVAAFRLGENTEAWLWDRELPGFGLRMQRGGLKTYYVQYRTGGRGSASRRVVLGSHTVLSPEEARKEARAVLAQVRLGADPARARNMKRKEPTVSALCDRYITEHVKAHNKPSTAAEINRVVETKIKPQLGNTKISDLSRAKVKEWHSAMSASPYEANRSLAYLSKMLSLAVKEWELLRENPCLSVKRFPEHRRERFFTDDELKRIGAALREIESQDRFHCSAIAVLRLLAVTGLRVSEALSLTWQEVALDQSCLHLKDAKAGARTVPLGAAARLFLKDLARNGKFVFWGPAVDAPISQWTVRKLWDDVRTLSKVPSARIHDFRHTTGTYAAQTGANAFMVRDILGHKSMAMTGRYVERDVDPIRATVTAVAARVDAAMSGKPANVVSMKRTSRK
jgi:integrase